MTPAAYLTQARTVATLQGRTEYADCCLRTPEQQSLAVCALAVQMGTTLADEDLIEWARWQCRDVAPQSAGDEVLYRLIFDAAPILAVDCPDEYGFYAASIMASRAWWNDNLPLLERLLERLKQVPQQHHSAINPVVPLYLFDLLFAFKTTGHFQRERLEAMTPNLSPDDAALLHWEVHAHRNKLRFPCKRN